MADNVNVTPGSGIVLSTKDIGGIQQQRMLLSTLVTGTTVGDFSTANASIMLSSVTANAITGANAIPTCGIAEWSVVSTPAANAQASAVKAAGTGTVKHICTGIFASIGATTTAPAAVNLTVNLLDGATTIWAETLSITATAGTMAAINIRGLALVGSATSSMTLQFSAAGGANTVETCTLTGFDIQ